MIIVYVLIAYVLTVGLSYPVIAVCRRIVDRGPVTLKWRMMMSVFICAAMLPLVFAVFR